jgi:hypothetical protein
MVVQSNGPQTEIELCVVGNKLSVTFSGDPGTVTVNHSVSVADIDSLRECVRKIVSLLEEE